MGCAPSELARNGASDVQWAHANAPDTVAAKARLEALSQLAHEEPATFDPSVHQVRLRRLAYSSVLIAENQDEAKQLLCHIFLCSLQRNPQCGIGGVLHYEESTRSLVQVLEGPVFTVAVLFHKILNDRRHMAVRKMWQVDVWDREYEGFGMKLASTMTQIPRTLTEQADAAAPAASAHKEDLNATIKGASEPAALLLRLTYISTLLARHETAYRLMQDVLHTAIVNNPLQQIGGCLFLNQNTLRVLQVLEGPEGAVRKLYSKIQQDMRHDDCKVLSELRVDHRLYPEWGMLQGELADWSSLATPVWTTPGMEVSEGASPQQTQDASEKNALLGASAGETSSLLHGAPPSPLSPKARLYVGSEGAVVRWDDAVVGVDRSPARRPVPRWTPARG